MQTKPRVKAILKNSINLFNKSKLFNARMLINSALNYHISERHTLSHNG